MVDFRMIDHSLEIADVNGCPLEAHNYEWTRQLNSSFWGGNTFLISVRKRRLPFSVMDGSDSPAPDLNFKTHMLHGRLQLPDANIPVMQFERSFSSATKKGTRT
jgi:hypothetical protein